MPNKRQTKRTWRRRKTGGGENVNTVQDNENNSAPSVSGEEDPNKKSGFFSWFGFGGKRKTKRRYNKKSVKR